MRPTLEEGLGAAVIRKYKTELSKIQELASREDPDALFHLGLMHYEGWGIPSELRRKRKRPVTNGKSFVMSSRNRESNPSLPFVSCRCGPAVTDLSLTPHGLRHAYASVASDRELRDKAPPVTVMLPEHVKVRDVHVQPHRLEPYDQLKEQGDE